MRSWMVLFVVLAGCDFISVKPSGGSDTGSADADTDTDADTDADSDADSDTDTDVDTALCDESLSTADPGGPACFTDTLGCGDVVEATNEGGESGFVGEDWESWFCTPNLDRWDYESPERVYSMFIPADTTATFDFETPCADLDLFVVYWQDEDSCPGSGSSIRECETVDEEGNGGHVSVWSDVGAWYVVAVDGRGGETGNFRLSVDCED